MPGVTNPCALGDGWKGDVGRAAAPRKKLFRRSLFSSDVPRCIVDIVVCGTLTVYNTTLISLLSYNLKDAVPFAYGASVAVVEEPVTGSGRRKRNEM